jgi:hypothetical protein
MEVDFFLFSHLSSYGLSYYFSFMSHSWTHSFVHFTIFFTFFFSPEVVFEGGECKGNIPLLRIQPHSYLALLFTFIYS